MFYPMDESLGDKLMTGLVVIACLGIGILIVKFMLGA